MFSHSFCFSQKIVKSEIDKFSKERRIETDEFNHVINIFTNMKMSLRSIGENCFMNISGNFAPGLVGTRDAFVFLLDNDSTVTIYPTGIQSTEGRGTDEFYDHQYAISASQVELLALHKVKSFRRYFNSNYKDLDLKNKFPGKIQALCKVFYTEFIKHQVL